MKLVQFRPHQPPVRARDWQLTIYGVAPAHPGLFVATSEGFEFVMLLGEHTVARFLQSVE